VEELGAMLLKDVAQLLTGVILRICEVLEVEATCKGELGLFCSETTLREDVEGLPTILMLKKVMGMLGSGVEFTRDMEGIGFELMFTKVLEGQDNEA
jgi:hypothetical protein